MLLGDARKWDCGKRELCSLLSKATSALNSSTLFKYSGETAVAFFCFVQVLWRKVCQAPLVSRLSDVSAGCQPAFCFDVISHPLSNYSL